MVHAVNLAEYVKDATVSAVVDSDLAAAEHASDQLGAPPAFASLEQALDADVLDAAVVPPPTFPHGALTLLAVAAGKHVFCEKPMALDLMQGREMISAVDRA